jgi:hypothetical protein
VNWVSETPDGDFRGSPDALALPWVDDQIMNTSPTTSGAAHSRSDLTLSFVLERERTTVVTAALESIRHSRTHYGAAGPEETRRRLDALYDELCGAVSSRDLSCIIGFAQHLAAERFHSGYDLSEVQCAFNSLEEALWSMLGARLRPDQHAFALGLVSTVLGTAKAELAREYVSLASQTRVQSLDVSALFSGDAGT